MASIVPYRFLVRLAHPCPYVKQLDPHADDAGLPASAVIQNYPHIDERENFADVRLAWNDFGIGMELIVEGKKQPPVGDANKPRSSDGLSLWIDTRDARTSHRASRYCHQFHFLPRGGGVDQEEPVVQQTKINRALQDAPIMPSDDILFRCDVSRSGYHLQAFLPAAGLTGFDPEQFPRLGFYYHVRDEELGEQYLSVNQEFPFSDDPSIWEILELVRV